MNRGVVGIFVTIFSIAHEATVLKASCKSEQDFVFSFSFT